MRYFPFFFDLRGASVLIVGGGVVAARKAELLGRAQARPRIVAPVVKPELADFARKHGGEVRIRHYRKTDLRRCRVAVCATDDPELNRRVRNDARAAGVPVNVVDQPDLCDFIFPALADRDPVCVAASSAGASPVLARMLRNKLENELPPNLGRVAELCERHRDSVRNTLPEKRRRLFWESALNSPAASAALNGDPQRADELLRDHLARFAADEQSVGEVFLIGAGPGDPELMTFKAQRLLQRADVVFYDRLVSREIVDLARRDAEKIFVGKTRAKHFATQEQINAALIVRAQSGEVVARLKGGDPLVFGRGGEEAAALAKAGVPFQIVPGVTAANGCAAFAGIPLTHRGVARAVRLETAYREDMMSPDRWRRLAEDREATLVFYMAGASLSAVADNLILGGKSPTTAVAVICGGATLSQKVIGGELRNIAARAKGEMFSPALIVVGDAVKERESLQWFCGDAGAEVPFSQIA